MAWHNLFEPPSPDPIYRCPCCRYSTLHERGGCENCPVCFWEDDGQDDHDADVVRGGPNRYLSLTEARLNYQRIGAADPQNLPHVRPPTDAETASGQT
jgi:hypothetical protein